MCVFCISIRKCGGHYYFILTNNLFVSQPLVLYRHSIVTEDDADRVWSCVENAVKLMAEAAEEEED